MHDQPAIDQSFGKQAVSSDERRARMTDADYSFVSSTHMEQAFAHVPEAIANTRRIASGSMKPSIVNLSSSALRDNLLAASTAYWRAHLASDADARHWLTSDLPGLLRPDDRFEHK